MSGASADGRWLQLAVRAPAEFAEPIAALFAKYGDAPPAIEAETDYDADAGPPPPISEVTVKAYLREGEGAQPKRDAIEAGIKLMSMLAPISEPDCKLLNPADWVDRLPAPLRVGRRLLIVPPGEQPADAAGRIVIPLAPGLGFGTGSHPTTAMMLECLEELDGLAGASVLDVGIGSGILSMAAVLLGASGALGLDTDEQAIGAARANAELSGLADAVRVERGTLSAGAGGYGVVLANITSVVLLDLASALAGAVAPGGALLCSGILVQRADEVAGAFLREGLRLEFRRQRGDWVLLLLRRAVS